MKSKIHEHTTKKTILGVRRTLKFLSFALILVVGMIFTFQSCNKDETVVVNPNELFKPTEYNLNLNDFAIALSKAVNEHDDLRKLIKEESLLMFDGDYDILMKQFKSKSVTDSKTKKSVIVKDLLLSYYPQEKRNKGANDIIDELTALYPDLQISVPVNAENWDEDFVPKVTFLSEEYSEQTSYIPGYKNGEISAVDAINVPDEPVIVIGLNERIIDDNGGVFDPPNIEIMLTGITTESGIRLTWVNTPNSGGPIMGYNIYRKKAGQPTFQLLSINNGLNNKTYDDINTQNLVSYSYYVTAFNDEGVSDASNIVNVVAPNKPNSVLNFDAILMATDDLELRWVNDYSTYIDGTRIFKRTIGIDPLYVLFGTYDTNTHLVIDNNLPEGKKVNYYVEQFSNLGTSNIKHDFIQVPYRDFSQATNVYVEKIKFDNWDIEHWPNGAPEFRLTVANANPTQNSSTIIQDKMNFDYNNAHSYQSFNGKNILSWKPDIWYDMLSFNLIEEDGGRTTSITLNSKFKQKNEENSAFGSDLSISHTLEIKDKDENCGNAYYSYYDPSTTWIYFPNYGARIKVSDIDIIESYNTTDGF